MPGCSSPSTSLSSLSTRFICPLVSSESSCMSTFSISFAISSTATCSFGCIGGVLGGLIVLEGGDIAIVGEVGVFDSELLRLLFSVVDLSLNFVC